MILRMPSGDGSSPSSNATRRSAALAELSDANSATPTTRAAAEDRIDNVLRALEDVADITGADTSGIRRTLDSLLRTRELEWAVLP